MERERLVAGATFLSLPSGPLVRIASTGTTSKALCTMNDDKNDARTHFTRGLELAAQWHLDDAIAEYRKADQLRHKDELKDRKLVLRNWAEALRLQERYKHDIGRKICEFPALFLQKSGAQGTCGAKVTSCSTASR